MFLRFINSTVVNNRVVSEGDTLELPDLQAQFFVGLNKAVAYIPDASKPDTGGGVDEGHKIATKRASKSV